MSSLDFFSSCVCENMAATTTPYTTLFFSSSFSSSSASLCGADSFSFSHRGIEASRGRLLRRGEARKERMEAALALLRKRTDRRKNNKNATPQPGTDPNHDILLLTDPIRSGQRRQRRRRRQRPVVLVPAASNVDQRQDGFFTAGIKCGRRILKGNIKQRVVIRRSSNFHNQLPPTSSTSSGNIVKGNRLARYRALRNLERKARATVAEEWEDITQQGVHRSTNGPTKIQSEKHGDSLHSTTNCEEQIIPTTSCEHPDDTISSKNHTTSTSTTCATGTKNFHVVDLNFNPNQKQPYIRVTTRPKITNPPVDHHVALLNQNRQLPESAGSHKTYEEQNDEEGIQQAERRIQSELISHIHQAAAQQLPLASDALRYQQQIKQSNSIFVRNYVHQTLDAELDQKVSALLSQLRVCQDEARRRKPTASKWATQRLVFGLKAISQKLDTNAKLKFVVIAPNIEPSLIEGSANDQVMKLIAKCSHNGVPVIFALSRNKLGKAVGLAVRQSAVGVTKTPSLFAETGEVIRMADKLRAKFTQDILKKNTSEDTNCF